MSNSSDKSKILLVDSNPGSVQELQELLEGFNVEIFAVGAAEEALRLALYSDFSMIFIDLTNPDEEKIQAGKKLRENLFTGGISLVFCVSPGEEEALQDLAYDGGVVDVLYKPFNRIVLQSKVRALLDYHSLSPGREAKAQEVLERPKVLVVDDTPANILVMKKLLRKLDVTIVTASSGNEALTETLYNDFAVVFLDVQMPEMDGYEVAELMKTNEKTANVPIIFLTAIDRDDAKEIRGYDTGAVDFIFKPINEHILLSKARIFLDLYLMRVNLEGLVAQRTAALETTNTMLRDEILRKEAAEHELMRMEKYLRCVIDSISSIVIGAGEDGTITNVNLEGIKRSGFSLREAKGEPVGEIFPEFAMILKEMLEELQDSNEPIEKFNVPIVADEVETVHNFSITPLIGGESENQVVITIDDVTDMRRMEKELQQRRHIDSLGELAGGIAHDFNNLLGAIMGASELLQLKAMNNTKLESPIQIISVSVERATELVGKLLSFARKSDINKLPLDVHRVLDDTTTILKRSIDKRITVEIEENASHSVVEGGLSELSNAFLNLAVNARDAMPTGGNLIFSTSNVVIDEEGFAKYPGLKEGHYLEVKVSDTGTGIPEEIRQKIFDPFFTTKEPGKGTGLGLASVYGTIKEHGGIVQLDSIVDVGTTFSIILPVTDKKYIPEVLSDSVLEGNKLEGTVLLVDDEDIIRAIGTGLLETLGLEVIPARNGKEALDIARNSADSISLVLLDLTMPEMNGQDCFRELQKFTPQTPVLICSGYLTKEISRELQDEGVKGLIRKPFHLVDLREALALHLPYSEDKFLADDTLTFV